MCNGRSIWTIDYRKFDDPDNDRSLRKHIGRNPKITKSILESENYHALHGRLYDSIHRFFSTKNIVIMICRSGRHRSVANAELWSNTVTRCSRRQHSVFFVALVRAGLGRNRCAGNCSECSKRSLRVFQTHYDQVQAECLRRVLVPDPVTGRWKRPRPEEVEGSTQYVKDPPDEEDHLPQTPKKRAASATETHPSRGILDEQAERVGNFHESARAQTCRLQKHDVSRENKRSMIEAARCMFHKLLGEARDDLDPATPRSQESLCTEIKKSKQRCSHTVILKENLCPRPEEPSEKSVPLPESAAETLEQVIEDDPRKQLDLSVLQCGEWKHEFKNVEVHYDNIELAFHRGGEEGQ